jgi:hypothetical protein
LIPKGKGVTENGINFIIWDREGGPFSKLATCYSKALKRLRNLQYVRRPGPDSGCSAIGWMEGGPLPDVLEFSNIISNSQSLEGNGRRMIKVYNCILLMKLFK